MSEWVATGVAMAAFYGAWKLWERVQDMRTQAQALRARSASRTNRAASPRDLGTLKRDNDGVFVPANPTALPDGQEDA